MQIKKELAEMHDGRVQLISLVETGANAAPFKKLKSENPEGDTDVFRAEKLQAAAADGPTLIALAVSPKGDVKAAEAIAKAAGIEIQDTREVEGDDGTTTLLVACKQTRVNTADPNQVQVRLDDELIAVCHVEKMFIPFNGETSFAEAIKSQGFFPQLRGALDVFGEVAYHILDSVDSPAEAAVAIKASGDELVSLLTLMTKALPKDTFKAAKVIEALKAEKPESAETPTSKEKDEAAAKEKADAEAKKKAEGDGNAITEKAVHVDDEDEDEKGKNKKGAKKEDVAPSDLDKILEAIAGLTTTIVKQGEVTDDLKKQIETVAEKAEEAEEAATAATKKAESTDKAVSGRVSTSPAGDESGRSERKVKMAPPLEDTG
ncbi:hypothetical protein LCGC14_1777210, partial [marine sediment metagenome]